MERKLPALHTIIYNMEDFSTGNNFWLDITKGHLAEFAPEALEAQPGLLGKTVFLPVLAVVVRLGISPGM